MNGKRWQSMSNHRNWAGNFAYGAAALQVPENMEQAQEWVARSERVKVLGTRHSFNGIADTSGVHLSLEKLNKIVALDPANRRVTVEAGIRYGDLCRELHDRGYALHNLASLPHITVAGAVATATHGSGDGNGNLATVVQAIEIVQGNGETVTFTRGQADGLFEGAVVGLGALGVVTKLTLDVIPAYQVCQHVYELLPLAQLEEHLDAVYASAYSVSLFTDWRQAAFNQVWVKRVWSGPDDERGETSFYGARPAAARLHPVPGQPSENCSEQLGVPGPSYERLPHFRMDFTPSAGEELQSEYIVPRRHAYDALCAIERMRARIAPLLYVSEVRSIARDDLWMSPNYERDSIGIHFTWKSDWPAVRQVLSAIEQALEPYAARPHWGKLFVMSPDQVQAQYEKLRAFRELVRRCDPQGKFRNGFLDCYL